MGLPKPFVLYAAIMADTFRQSATGPRLFWVTLAIVGLHAALRENLRQLVATRDDASHWEVPALPLKPRRLAPIEAKNSGKVFSGEMTLGFGAVKVPIGRSRDDSVRLLSVLASGALTDTVGILLALLDRRVHPTFLEPQSATVLLAKPAPRWSILLGKYWA